MMNWRFETRLVLFRADFDIRSWNIMLFQKLEAIEKWKVNQTIKDRRERSSRVKFYCQGD